MTADNTPEPGLEEKERRCGDKDWCQGTPVGIRWAQGPQPPSRALKHLLLSLCLSLSPVIPARGNDRLVRVESRRLPRAAHPDGHQVYVLTGDKRNLLSKSLVLFLVQMRSTMIYSFLLNSGKKHIP